MNIHIKFLMLLSIPLVLFMGCEEDDEPKLEGDPKITISTTRSSLAEIDLDKGTGPNIRGWAVAPEGLASVTITVDKTSGSEEILNVTSFDDENSERGGVAYNFNVLPHYTPEFTGITVTAIDVKNKMDTVVWKVKAEGGTAGPKMTGITEGPIEANVRPSVDIRPKIEGSISSHWGLKSVTFVQVYEGSEEVLVQITDFGDTPNQHTVDIVPDYDKGYAQGMTAFRIEAVDNRDNMSSDTIAVNVIDAAPAPRIHFDFESLEADLTSNPQIEPTVTGSITSTEGLASVNYFLVRSTGDVAFGDEITTFEDPNEFNFSVDPEYSLGVTGFKVVAVDALGQSASAMVSIKVIADDPDLSVYRNVVLHGTADRHDDGIHTAFSTRDGTPVTLFEAFNDPDLAATVDFIVADSGGNNELDIFSPDGNSWLDGNYFKDEVSNDTRWAVLNETRMRQLDPGEIDFESATSIDIEALDLGDWELRVDPLFPGDLVLFVTNQGKKGIISYVSTNDDPGKADIFTFDIKVLK